MKNSTIKTKVAACLDCGRVGPVTAGRCQTDYWKYRAEVNKSKLSNKEKKEDKKLMGVFMAAQLLAVPENCENCGYNIAKTTSVNRRIAIAHIVPKAYFKSVKIHPLNRWFACWNCHNFYDQNLELQQTMEVAPRVMKRFKEFCGLIPLNEARRLPEYLKLIYDGEKREGSKNKSE